MKTPTRLLNILQKAVFPAAGAIALLWFVIRVVPKPSRAAYPCMRAAFPVASSFVIWLLSLLGMRLAWRHLLGNMRRRPIVAMLAGACGLLAGVVWLASQPGNPALAAVNGSHGPLGEGKGVFPGRVVWVHAPDATSWGGKSTGERWSDPGHSHEPTIGRMMDEAICSLGGGKTVAGAWDNMFHEFNGARGKGEQGYKPGEKIMIKINLTLTNATMNALDDNYNKIRTGWLANYWNNIDVSPQAIIALLRQLVYDVGVAESDITIGDTVCLVPNYLWNLVHPEFPDVKFVENWGLHGRERAEFSTTPFHWSHPDATGKVKDYLPTCYAEAAYIINFAIPKSHAFGGITACAKNHYGSFLRTPVGNLRDYGDRNYFNLHESLPDSSVGTPGSGQYRSLVDIMGHPELGGKTILYLLDGLFSGHGWEGDPEKWQMAPFNGDWPSSLFASMDPVAIDSVAYDFLATEWPDEVLKASLGENGAQDYLHEAAQAGDPPSGTFYDPADDGSGLASLGVHEHWNNAIDKQYSRNLGADFGIELVPLEITEPVSQPALALRLAVDDDQLLLRVVHTDPATGYILEQVNPGAGSATSVLSIPKGAYGRRISRPFNPGASQVFYRIRKQ
ncbi:MAG: DUF362 domain-containing protein [Oceanipulchritudo sp.]